MNIKSVNTPNSAVYNVNTANLKNKYNSEADNSQVASRSKLDKLELSDEAKKIQDIKSRVQSGFYDNPNVLREIAIKLDRELFPAK